MNTTSNREFAEFLQQAVKDGEQFETCMALNVCQDGKAVELWLDTGLSTYSQWIEGEGADIGLMRCQETDKVVGVRLPILKNNLCVHHDGPIRINAGFRKDDIHR